LSSAVSKRETEKRVRNYANSLLVNVALLLLLLLLLLPVKCELLLFNVFGVFINRVVVVAAAAASLLLL